MSRKEAFGITLQMDRPYITDRSEKEISTEVVYIYFGLLYNFYLNKKDEYITYIKSGKLVYKPIFFFLNVWSVDKSRYLILLY